MSNGRVISNIYWALAGKVVNLVSGLVVGIMVARFLGPEQFGLMNYVISFVFLFQTISVFGLDNIEVREESRADADRNVILGTAFGIRVVLSLVCMIAVVLTSWFIDANRYVTLLVAIYSLTVLFNSFSVIRNHFYALMQNKYVVMSEITRTVISMSFKVLLLVLEAPLIWFVIACMLDVIYVASGYCICYRRAVGSMRDWRFDLSTARFLIKESFPLLLSSAAVIVYQRIDQVMIKQLIDADSVGYFSVASRIVEILIYIPMILAQTIQPVLVQAREQSEESYRQKASSFMNISLWGSFVASAVVSVLAYWIITILFGQRYLLAVPVLQIMAFKAVSVALSNTAGTMLVVEGLQRWAMLRDVLGCICCVALNYVLLPAWGIVAAAVVAIASNLVAGYLADALIPAYRHLFVCQTKALLLGWLDLRPSRLLELRRL